MAAFQTILGLASKVEDWPTYEELYSGECEHQMVQGRYRLMHQPDNHFLFFYLLPLTHYLLPIILLPITSFTA